MATIADNLQVVKARIGARPGVTLLAVSKGHEVERIREAAAAGQEAFGENYVQDALPKIEALPQLEWHLIGPLQANKTRAVAGRFDWVHTIEREKIARRLSEQRPEELAPLNVLVQVNVSGEATKSGVAPGEVLRLARAVHALPRLRLRGLMAIPEPTPDTGSQRKRFSEVRASYLSLRDAGLEVDTLSMGMSEDMEAAIAEGSTLVRIGTAIFGAREKARDAA